jgi:hypothetical protein
MLMDLISIGATFWRHKIVTIPLILLTLVGAYYVVKIKPPVYQANTSFLLSVPPGPPTAAQIAADPALRKINPNNPYTAYGNMSVAAAVLVDLVTTPAAQQQLVREGVDPRYTVAPNTAFGFQAPVIQITGVGSTAQEAIVSASLVSAAAKSDLYQMQKTQGVNKLYMIKALPLVLAEKAQISASSKLRELIAIAGLGAVALFVAVSVADALARRRKERRADGAAPRQPMRNDAQPEHRRQPAGEASKVRSSAPHNLQRRTAGTVRRET